MSTNSFSPQEITLANAWVNRWLEFIALINRVTGTDKTLPIIPNPTALDEAEYMLSRTWFLENELAFILLWTDFGNFRLEQEDVTDEESTIDPEMQKYTTNIFLYFYEPKNLYKLAVHLDLQSSDLVWEPHEETMSVVRPFMVSIGRLAVDFLHWIENSAHNN